MPQEHADTDVDNADFLHTYDVNTATSLLDLPFILLISLIIYFKAKLTLF